MSEQLRGATPPNSLEAERSVLGAMLQDERAVSLAIEALKPDDFYQPAHREIYAAMQQLVKNQSPVDLITVDTELSRTGMLEGIGGTQYLIGLSQYVPTTANVRAYIGIVQEKSVLRQLIGAAQSITQQCYTQKDPLPEVMNHAEKSIFDIVMNRSGGDTLVLIKDVLFNTYAQMEELSRLKGRVSGVPTGFTDLDRMLTGMHAGELILIGARPSMGKTSFAMNIASYAALQADKKVAVFSLEMPREQIALRMLCSEARVDMQRVRQGTMADADWMRIAQAIAPLSHADIYIDDTAGITPTQLRSKCRQLMMNHGLDLIVLDYLGLMHSDTGNENRQQEVSTISRQLKAIALELKIPLIACAQLSRASASRDNKRPILSDLRDSGSIEQDADVVMFLYRDAYYNPETEDKNIGEVILSKQRNGPLGTVRLAWLSEYTTYANLSPEAASAATAPF